MIFDTTEKLIRKMHPRRRIHCFCLGAAKTGTTSFASMFVTDYRSAHEPETVALTEAVAKILDSCPSPGRAGEQRSEQKVAPGLDIAAWLQARDRRLNLEVEASHPLGYMAPWLPEAFPEARFVITIRDPLRWLKSRLNFHYYKAPPEWQKYRDLIWSRWHRGYHREEKLLEESGLYSIDAYLAQYAEQYQLLFRHLPEDRRLLVRTEELDTSAERIGAFLGIDPATITRQHANAFSQEDNVMDRLPEAFVARRIEAHCQWLKAVL
ncbi:MAG: sulfotransferase [Pseudohongiellaceae bacterium]